MKFMFTKLKLTSVAISISFFALIGCNESTSGQAGADFGNGSPSVSTSFNEQALVTNITDNIISPVLTEFANQARVQQQNIAAYCQSLTTESGVTEALTQAQASWRTSMKVWQQIEMMQLQPLLANDGKLRNDIYSWPLTSSCNIDFDTIFHFEDDFNGQPYDITTRRANRKGLYALEYLLFNSSTEHSCPAGSSAPDSWNNYTQAEITQARCEYAEAVAGDAVRTANIIVESWSGTNGYAQQLKNAGTTLSSINSVHAAVNQLSDAMFYLDSLTKDRKLATPLGLFANNCGSQVCPEEVESTYASHSVENIIGNLQGFDKFFNGDEGIGFIDYLRHQGDDETAELMSTAIAAAISQLEAYQSSLAQTLVNDSSKVLQTHENVKVITDELKNDFITSLALELPQTSAGDND